MNVLTSGIVRGRAFKAGLFPNGKSSITSPLSATAQSLVDKANSEYDASIFQQLRMTPTGSTNLSAFATSPFTSVRWELGRDINLQNVRSAKIIHYITNTSGAETLYMVNPFHVARVTSSLSSAASSSLSIEDRFSHLAYWRTLNYVDYMSIITEELGLELNQANSLDRLFVLTATTATYQSSPFLLPNIVIQPGATVAVPTYLFAGLLFSRGFNFRMLSGMGKLTYQADYINAQSIFSNTAIVSVSRIELQISGMLPAPESSAVIQSILDNPETRISLGFTRPGTQVFSEATLTANQTYNYPLSQLGGPSLGIYWTLTPQNPDMGATINSGGSFYQNMSAQNTDISLTVPSFTATSAFIDGSAFDVSNFNLLIGSTVVNPSPDLPASALRDFEYFASHPNWRSPAVYIYDRYSHIYPWNSDFIADRYHGSCAHGVVQLSGNTSLQIVPSTTNNTINIGVCSIQYSECLFTNGDIIPINNK